MQANKQVKQTQSQNNNLIMAQGEVEHIQIGNESAYMIGCVSFSPWIKSIYYYIELATTKDGYKKKNTKDKGQEVEEQEKEWEWGEQLCINGDLSFYCEYGTWAEFLRKVWWNFYQCSFSQGEALALKFMSLWCEVYEPLWT